MARLEYFDLIWGSGHPQMNLMVGLKLRYEFPKFGISGLPMIQYKIRACLSDVCVWDETWWIVRH